MRKQAVHASDADICDARDARAEELSGDSGFFGHRKIAGAGTDDGDTACGFFQSVLQQSDAASESVEFCCRHSFANRIEMLLRGARCKRIHTAGSEPGKDGSYLRRRLAG